MPYPGALYPGTIYPGSGAPSPADEFVTSTGGARWKLVRDPQILLATQTAESAQTSATNAKTAADKAVADAALSFAAAEAAELSSAAASGAALAAETAADQSSDDAAAALARAQAAGTDAGAAQTAANQAQAAADASKVSATAAGTSAAAADAKAAQAAADAAKAVADAAVAAKAALDAKAAATAAKDSAAASATKATAAQTAADDSATSAATAVSNAAAAAEAAEAAEGLVSTATGAAATAETAADASAQAARDALAQAEAAGSNVSAAQSAAAAAQTAADASMASADTAGTAAAAADAAAAQSAADAAKAVAAAAESARLAGLAQESAGSAASNAELAVQSSNGKTTNYRDITGPVGVGKTLGDVWSQFKDDTWTLLTGQWVWSGGTTAAGWKRYKQDHTTLGSVDIATLSVIGQSTLADVVAQKIAAQTGAFINLGVEQLTVTGGAHFKTAVMDLAFADMFSVRKLTANQIVVGADLDSFAPSVGAEPDLWSFEGGSYIFDWDAANDGKGVRLIDAPGTVALFGPYRPTKGGEEWYAEVVMGLYAETTANVQLRIYWYDKNKTYMVSTFLDSTISHTGSLFMGSAVAPVGAVFARYGLLHYGTTSTAGWVSARDMRGGPKLDGTLIVDGAITAKKITASEEMSAKLGQFLHVKTGMLEANAVTADTADIGSLRTGILTANVVDSTMIKADAITTKHTLTGPLYQTVGTAYRGIKISNPLGIKQYDSNGNTEISIIPGGNNLITGSLQTAIDGKPGIKIINSNVHGYPGVFFSSDGTTNTQQAAIFGRYAVSGTREMVLRAPDRDLGSSARELGLVRVEGHLIMSLGAGGQNILRSESPMLLDAFSPYNGSQRMELAAKDMIIGTSSGNIRIDSNSFYTQLPGVYNKAVGSAGNVVISSDGGLFRSTSASKYKLDIQEMPVSETLLGVRVKDWVDKSAVAESAALNGKPWPLQEMDMRRLNALSLKRIPGHIAEDVESLGGSAFVTYGEDGQIEGLMYDRLNAARIQIIIDKLAGVESRLNVLEGAK